MGIFAHILRLFRSAPPEPDRRRRIARRFACPYCSRVVAHTASGRPYNHNCRPVNLLPPDVGGAA